MGRVINGINGFGILFRFITPAFLGVLIWSVQDIKADVRSLAEDVKTLTNHQASEAAALKERLGRLEERNVTLNGVSRRR